MPFPLSLALAPGARRVGRYGRTVRLAMASALGRHRVVHSVALFALALAFAIAPITGNRPDFEIVGSYGFFLAAAFWIAGCSWAVGRLAWLAVVERNPSPAGALSSALFRFFADPDRLANSVNGIVAVMIFSSAFAVLKGAISILEPFAWDRRLAALDRAIHFGRAPHEWLWWLIDRPLAVAAVNAAYNLWFFVLIGAIFTVAIARKDSRLRHQFLLTLMLVWLVGGFFLATGLSSAGPCYFARIGDGPAYQPLMDALAEANVHFTIWALPTQDLLWEGYAGISPGTIGISAFPSLHVASAVLFALYAMHRSALAGTILWIFAALIMLGSVVLGWHYAVDGYAGALLTLLTWKMVGHLLARQDCPSLAEA